MWQTCVLKSRHHLANKGLSSQSYSFSSCHVWCERWSIKKAEHQRVDAFELWCWSRLLRVPWTARRSSQSILKDWFFGRTDPEAEDAQPANYSVQFSSAHSRVRLFATPWIAARQASLSITNSRSSLRLKSIESVMPSSHPSHPLSSPSPPAPNPSQHQSLFQWVNSLHEVAKVLEFQL